MKRVVVAGIIGIVVYSYGVCIDIKQNQPSSLEIELYKKTFPYAARFSKEKIAKEIDKNRVFANAFLKKHQKLDKNTTKELQFVVESFLASKYIEEFKRTHAPTEKELKSFYLDHKESFKPVEKVSISVIAVDSLEKADRIYLHLKDHPQDFHKIAKKESIDPMAKSGGLYENVPITTFVPSVRRWIRTHKEGDISEPIKVGRYYFIDKIEEKIKSDNSYENLKEDIKEILMNAYVTNRIEQEYERLQSEDGSE